MIEQKALAYVNMWGVLGSLENLCALDAQAKAELQKLSRPTALCFSVKGGPTSTFHFSKAGCTMTQGDTGCTHKMIFSSPERFNDLINNSKPGLPVKNSIGTLAFLTGTFTRLTDRLNAVLRPTADQLEDGAFLEENTLMTLYVLAGAIPALANYDSISRVSAAHTADGSILLGVKDKAYITLQVKDHRYSVSKEKTDSPRAVMEFADIDLAHRLFAGTASTINEMCKGTLYLSGMVSMLDNVNRILDRASVYLA